MCLFNKNGLGNRHGPCVYSKKWRGSDKQCPQAPPLKSLPKGPRRGGGAEGDGQRGGGAQEWRRGTGLERQAAVLGSKHNYSLAKALAATA